ncbi:G-type lectin S-receptor-like serine/threonine-protein kinase RKS1 [Linum perenne]
MDGESHAKSASQFDDCIPHQIFAAYRDRIVSNESTIDGSLVISKGGRFALGFFSPGSSRYRYLGIWYFELPERTVVWVANRNSPITGSSGVLAIDGYGNLSLYSSSENKVPVWSAKVSSGVHGPWVAQLLDSGNLVLMMGGVTVWQSFDYPTDTLLPGLNVGLNRRTGLNSFMTSWRSADDPGTGNFSLKLNPSGSPQLYVYQGTYPYWRSFSWPWPQIGGFYNYTFVDNEDGIYYSIEESSVLFRSVIDVSGNLLLLTWDEDDIQWKVGNSLPKQKCDYYGNCGPYSKCDPGGVFPGECSCLPGYEPIFPRKWNLGNGADGCVRKRLESSSACGSGEGFVRVEQVKIPDTSAAIWVDMATSKLDCEGECRKNCNCSAYGSINIQGKGTGCLTWYGKLLDTVFFPLQGYDFYVRVDALELADYLKESGGPELNLNLSIIVSFVLSVWLVLALLVYLWFKKWKKRRVKKRLIRKLFPTSDASNYYENSAATIESINHDSFHPELPFFSLSSIQAATNNFSPTTKLGEGGYSLVYKGKLPNGREVAVKRLSKNSSQGLEQFRNEVLLIAKLQHRNLVKLHGCCIEDDEQMLIYEYLPYNSLDSLLFVDESQRLFLDWKKRFNIIVGIARGILYLHQDSRFRIIHRDLKPSNILLDGELNPKISDFGMARMLEGDQVEGKTTRIGGTYGYMSPEYAIFGRFSVKSDVFSFGVILLETVTGKKINGFCHDDSSSNLISHVWELWKAGRAAEIIDSTLSLDGTSEALRCIQIGLLCVEENASDRPNMLTVVLMLNSETTPVPSPRKPAFVACLRSKVSVTLDHVFSVNEMSFSGHGLERDGRFVQFSLDVDGASRANSAQQFDACIAHQTCTAYRDMIVSNESITDGSLVISEGGRFTLGFFSPGSSRYRYLGIWYYELPEKTVVWVANRNNPITGSSGVLSVDVFGNLSLLRSSGNKVPVWSAKVSSGMHGPWVAQLLDSGNLVLMMDGVTVWQSSDYPTDTLLPGLNVGLNRRTGLNSFMTSWRSADDPGTGNFSFKLNPSGSPQFYLYQGTYPYWRSFSWPWPHMNGFYNYSFVDNEDGIYHSIEDSAILFRLVIDVSGNLLLLTWDEDDIQWKVVNSLPKQKCDFFRSCGPYSKCDPSTVFPGECSCLPGYEPIFPRKWNLGNGSDGCVRKRLESSSFCGSGEGFVRVEQVKIPDTSAAIWVDMATSKLDCEGECKKNCNCSAYGSINIEGKGAGCLTWYGRLLDTVLFPLKGYDFYVRVDALELADYLKESSDPELKLKLSIIVPSVVSVWLVLALLVYMWFKKWKKRRVEKRLIRRLFPTSDASNYYENSAAKRRSINHDSFHPELPFFSLSSIQAATNNFCPTTKLGEGGYSLVYKGKLPNGKEVAVKRLSKNSSQGLEQFKNEVLLIAKLQHRNLVKLHGCCIEDDEQMLIYEYLPCNSLDSLLFVDESQRLFLDWKKRFNIIIGIARGILYLHQDSRFRIIHRDLKPSNILLDGELNPKISDFGMARMLEGDQVEGKTNRIGGTYGYMSPEYAIFGRFSVKSDVFSFGVILLEAVTGKKINGFSQEDPSSNLISRVWELWKAGRAAEIIDSTLSLDGTNEALRCIQIGLLCVEENPSDRPNMLTVVLMLNSETTPVPSPRKPAFVACLGSKVSVTLDHVFSVNEMSFSGFLSR